MNRTIIRKLKNSAAYWILSAILLLTGTCVSSAQITLDVIKEFTPTVTMAIVPLDRGVDSEESTRVVETAAKVIQDDLEFAEYFKFVPNKSWVIETHESEKAKGIVDYPEWKRLGANAIIKGVYKKQGSNISLDMLLVSVDDRKTILGKNYSFPETELRRVCHMFSDLVIEKYTQRPGVARTKIAFVNFHGGVKELYVMDYDGHENSVKRLTYDNDISLFPAWSPDGTQLSYMSYKNGNPDLYLFDFTTGLSRHFLGQPGINTAPAWHPDGRELAVTLSRDGNAEVYSTALHGNVLQRLTKNPAGDCSPAWSPGGQQIAFTSDRRGRPHIFVMNADGSNVRQLTSGAWQDDNAAWSPDGNWIAFSSSAGRNFDIYLVSPSSGDTHQLTRGEGSNESPSWAPDSQHIVFSSTRAGPSQIYVMDIDGKDVRRLTYLPGDNQTPSWSPVPYR